MKRKVSLWLVLGFVAYSVGIYAWITARGVQEVAQSVHSQLKPRFKGRTLIYDRMAQDTLTIPDEIPGELDSLIVENMAFVRVRIKSTTQFPGTFIARHMGGMVVECEKPVKNLNVKVADMAVLTIRCNIDTLHVLTGGMGKLILSGEYNHVIGELRDASLITSEGKTTITHNQIKTHDSAKMEL